jgi:hypothetical protein
MWLDVMEWIVKFDPIDQTKHALKWSSLLIKEIATKLMGDGGTSDPNRIGWTRSVNAPFDIRGSAGESGWQWWTAVCLNAAPPSSLFNRGVNEKRLVDWKKRVLIWLTPSISYGCNTRCIRLLNLFSTWDGALGNRGPGTAAPPSPPLGAGPGCARKPRLREGVRWRGKERKGKKKKKMKMVTHAFVGVLEVL